MEFIKFILKTDPKQRPSINEILNNLYLKKFLNDYYLQSVCPLIIDLTMLSRDSYKAICEDKVHLFTSESEEGTLSISEKIHKGIKINNNKIKFLKLENILKQKKFSSESNQNIIKDNKLNHKFLFELQSANLIPILHKFDDSKNNTFIEGDVKNPSYCKNETDFKIPNSFE